jgi:cytochrome c-type biogenesis protein CcmH
VTVFGIPPLWLAIAAMIAISLAFVLPGLVCRRPAGRHATRSELNVGIHRDRIEELERERASGAIGASDYERARTEVERALLDEARDEAPMRDVGSRRTAAALALLVPVAAIALYLALGNPSAVFDADVPSDASGLAEDTDVRARLVAHLASEPRDARAWITLARIDMSADRFDTAAASYAKALAASPNVARDPDIWCEYADALGMAQGGKLAGKPAEMIQHAIALDATNARALEMAGSLEYERGDFRAASRYWKQLLARFAPDSPPHRELASAIARAERLAATSLSPPTPKGGG